MAWARVSPGGACIQIGLLTRVMLARVVGLVAGFGKVRRSRSILSGFAENARGAPVRASVLSEAARLPD